MIICEKLCVKLPIAAHESKHAQKNRVTIAKSNWGGYICKNFYAIFLQMETRSLKAYQAPRMEFFDLELEQSVLVDSMSSTSSNTEKLNDEDFDW